MAEDVSGTENTAWVRFDAVADAAATLSIWEVMLCALVLIVGMFLTWTVPNVLHWLLHRVFSFELRTSTREVRDRAYACAMQPSPSSGESLTSPLASTRFERGAEQCRRRRIGSVERFFRVYCPEILYASLRAFLLVTSLIVAFWCLHGDLFSLITSVGIVVVIGFIQIGPLVANAFAHFYLLLSGSMRRGDCIAVMGTGTHGCVCSTGFMHVEVYCPTAIRGGPFNGPTLHLVPNLQFLTHGWTKPAVAVDGGSEGFDCAVDFDGGPKTTF